MNRQYWLDLFTGKTWEEFLRNGANISGFRENRKNIAQKIRLGDYFICYLTGVSRFIGILEVTSECYSDDKTSIWEDELFPVRFHVKLIYELNVKTAIPVHILRDKLSIFRDLKSPKAWSGFFRGSPIKFKNEDGEIITNAIKDAVNNPIEREYDDKKYWRRPKNINLELEWLLFQPKMKKHLMLVNHKLRKSLTKKYNGYC
jgi:predicted RNA-binding protein